MCETSSSSSAAISGPGATGKSGALVRCHYANVPEARLTHESLRIFRNWDEEVGAGSRTLPPIGFVQVVAPEHEDRLRQNVADQQAIGIETRVVDREELQEIDPYLYTDDLTVAAYEPGSGFADPNATLHGFARAPGPRGSCVRRNAGHLDPDNRRPGLRGRDASRHDRNRHGAGGSRLVGRPAPGRRWDRSRLAAGAHAGRGVSLAAHNSKAAVTGS